MIESGAPLSILLYAPFLGERSKALKVKTTQEIAEFLQPIADGMGIEIVDVEFKPGKQKK